VSVITPRHKPGIVGRRCSYNDWVRLPECDIPGVFGKVLKAVEMGTTLPVSTILAISGALGGGFAHGFIQTLQSKSDIDSNQLAYLIRLQESILPTRRN